MVQARTDNCTYEYYPVLSWARRVLHPLQNRRTPGRECLFLCVHDLRAAGGGFEMIGQLKVVKLCRLERGGAIHIVRTQIGVQDGGRGLVVLPNGPLPRVWSRFSTGRIWSNFLTRDGKRMMGRFEWLGLGKVLLETMSCPWRIWTVKVIEGPDRAMLKGSLETPRYWNEGGCCMKSDT